CGHQTPKEHKERKNGRSVCPLAGDHNCKLPPWRPRRHSEGLIEKNRSKSRPAITLTIPRIPVFGLVASEKTAINPTTNAPVSHSLLGWKVICISTFSSLRFHG